MNKMFPILALLMAFGWVNSMAQASKASSQENLILLEKARYFYDIENNFKQAETQLLELLKKDPNPAISTKIHFLLGRIYDEYPSHGSAKKHYQKAMNGEGLSKQELSWLYKKMLKIDPEDIKPMKLIHRAPSGLLKIFTKPDEDIKTLLLQNVNDHQFRLPVYNMNSKGTLDDHPASVPPDETLLDATSKICLAASRTKKTIKVYREPGKSTITLPYLNELAWGRILQSGTTLEILLVSSDRLRLYRNGTMAFEFIFPTPTCILSRSDQSPNSCYLRCPDNSLHHLDLRSQKVITKEGVSQKPIAIHPGAEMVVIQYSDHFELRSRVNFKKVIWTGPCKIQDRIFLYKNRLYLLKPTGIIQAYRTPTAQLIWQRDLAAEEVYPNNTGLLIKTFAHQTIALDLKGRINWSYNFGWDEEVKFLETNNWIIAHYQSGKRVSLNRELLNAAGESEEFLFTKYGKKLCNPWKQYCKLNREMGLPGVKKHTVYPNWIGTTNHNLKQLLKPANPPLPPIGANHSPWKDFPGIWVLNGLGNAPMDSLIFPRFFPIETKSLTWSMIIKPWFF